MAPRHWFATFPGLGLSWLPQLGPYNGHFARDVGAFFLGLTVLGLRAWLAAYRHRQLLTAAPVESTVAGEAERLAA